jgi:small-conductance mechanosensitive channel
MKGENLIHIKFEYFAGVQSKRDILSTEMDLLRMNKILNRYKEYRMQELELKSDAERKFRALKLDFGRLQNLLPSPQVPQILEKAHKKVEEEKNAGEEEIEITETPKIRMEEPKKDNLDAQLREIQKKLNALAG